MSQITTHILDTTRGRPAVGVKIILYAEKGEMWSELAWGTTNADGRLSDLLEEGVILAPGIYKLKFFTATYFEQLKLVSFYPFVEIVFSISSSEHYHVPLLLNPFGYSTYRGS